MELNHKKYSLSVRANLDGQDIKVIVNGEDTGAKLKHIFKKYWFATGEIIGYSILEYYSVKDGFLVDKEGNKIHFSCERFPEIKINKVSDPFIIFDEIEVNRDWVRDTGRLMNLENTEETVTDLSDEDKQVLISERENKRAEEAAEAAKIKAQEDERLAEEARIAEEEENTKKAHQERLEAEENARKSEELRIQAEKAAEEARLAEEEAKRIAEEEEKKYIVSQKQYDTISRRSIKSLGMKLYVKDSYHFFYAAKENLPKDEAPFILKKRENDYLELEGGLASENDEEAEYEFSDGNKDRVLIVNLDNGDVVVDELE